MEKYNGNKFPYLYALYTKEDREKVFAVLKVLDENGYHLDYEENKDNM